MKLRLKHQSKKSMNLNNGSLKNKQIDKSLVNLTKIRKEKAQIHAIKNGKGKINRSSAKTQIVIGNY